ncbi:hypothetical protein STRDD10_01483 [Streptococcus sp. DD10]|uniref:hypothetical protein n=1 Tax=Streptococcus sp. DD10 TaxID=1777878 RepID=UPI0007981B1E|nr:hypothetical protein [Streptococcus sp. DD10]KXT73564.1 hypothetical protein STRDD10_01483 [Streptococcus sp. DD10]
MKLHHSLLFIGAAGLSYQLFKNRKNISLSAKETGQSIFKIKENSQNISHNLTTIQEQLNLIQDLGQDIRYKVQILEKEAQARLHTIQDIWSD